MLSTKLLGNSTKNPDLSPYPASLGDGSLIIHPDGRREIMLTSSNYFGP